MNQLAKPIRRFLSFCRKILWKLSIILPINQKKVFVVSFYGRGYSDNSKQIVQELLSRNLDIKIYWAVKDTKNNDLPDTVIPVKYESLSYIFHMATAKIWIDNCRKWSYIVKKPEQTYINTYHSMSFKKIEADVEYALDKEYVNSAKKDSKMCNLLVSNSSFMTGLYQNSFWYSGEILECGSPRNDIFFKDIDRNRICQKANINPKNKFILYAPTFRKDGNLEVYDLDYQKIAQAYENRFGGKWQVLLRLHPNIASKSSQLKLSDEVVDVSKYDDMQELLTAVDSLIVDYSSSIFDYLLTDRPCFMYANDFDDYNKDRGLYFDLKDLPFKCAFNQTELLKYIGEFNQSDFSRKNQEFQKTYGFREYGNASKLVVDWLINKESLKKKS